MKRLLAFLSLTTVSPARLEEDMSLKAVPGFIPRFLIGERALWHTSPASGPVRTSCTDFLDAGHEGLVEEQAGVLFSPQGKFTYFASSGHPGTIQELIAIHDGNRDLFQMIADSAVDWDGKEPTRYLN
jgi:hypothetical protein